MKNSVGSASLPVKSVGSASLPVKISSLAAMLCLIASPLWAANLSGNAGAFADIGLGLRPFGMGGAYTALANDEHAARWNAALLGEVRDPSAGFSWANQFNVIAYNYFAIAYPVGQSGLGAGAYFLTAGDEVYSETTIGVGAGFSGGMFKISDKLMFGTTVKFYLTDFGNDPAGGIDRVTGSASGFGLDLSAAFRLSESFLFAVVGRDLVNNISWKSDNPDHSTKGNYSEGVPRVVSLAGAFHDEQIAISFDLQPSLYSDVPTRIGVGAEFVILKVLKPRFGLSQNFGSVDPNRTVSLGLGIDLSPTFTGPIKHVKFGYTHMVHDIDSTPRVGLTIGW